MWHSETNFNLYFQREFATQQSSTVFRYVSSAQAVCWMLDMQLKPFHDVASSYDQFWDYTSIWKLADELQLEQCLPFSIHFYQRHYVMFEKLSMFGHRIKVISACHPLLQQVMHSGSRDSSNYVASNIPARLPVRNQNARAWVMQVKLLVSLATQLSPIYTSRHQFLPQSANHDILFYTGMWFSYIIAKRFFSAPCRLWISCQYYCEICRSLQPPGDKLRAGAGRMWK